VQAVTQTPCGSIGDQTQYHEPHGQGLWVPGFAGTTILAWLRVSQPYSAGCKPRAAFAGFGAPTRKRRSDSDSRPPNAISTGPNQIKSTIGL